MFPQKPQIPTSVIEASRGEVDGDKLIVQTWMVKNNKLERVHLTTSAKLPVDLTGAYFFTAALPPRGIPYQSHDKTLDHGQQVSKAQGNLIINGDGMIYRLTFRQGEAQIRTRIAKTPCYYADFIVENDPETYPAGKYAFWNNGPSRMSASLGNRNQLNTAFLKTPDDRLLVTFDAGRPWEIDPDSMELLAPMGRKEEWLSIFPEAMDKLAFPGISSSAHPVCEIPNQRQLKPIERVFSLNYSVGYKGKFRKPIGRLTNALSRKLQNTGRTWRNRMTGFTDLICYDFSTAQPELRRWELVLDGKHPLIGEQSLHQVCITQNHIIFGDTAFRIEFSQLFFLFILGFPDRLLSGFGSYLKQLMNQVLNQSQSRSTKTAAKQRSLGLLHSLEAKRLQAGYWLYQVFRELLPPSQYTNFYILDRRQAAQYPGRTLDQAILRLRVRQVTIPREVSHFAVDYCDRNNQLTLHVGHINGWDVTEWIGQYDRPVKGKKKRFARIRLGGMLVGATDLGALGRYTVNAKTGELIDAKTVQDARLTWGVSIYTHRELDQNHQTIDQIYWLCTGFSWELIPERILEIYKASPLRVVPPEKLPDDKGKPLTLLRLDTQKMQIVDWFEFPQGYYASSPQFIPSTAPCPAERDPATHGYIACTVLSDSPEGDEIWIFDAANLGNRQDWGDSQSSASIIHRLQSPHKLNLGLSIHSIWCADEVLRKARKQYGDSSQRQQIRDAAFQNDYGTLPHPQITKNNQSKMQPCQNSRKDKKIEQIMSLAHSHFVDQTLENEIGQKP